MDPSDAVDGRYELRARLDDSAYGPTWLAADARLGGAYVAVKWCRRTTVNWVGEGRFHTEAALLVRVRHPNVVAVLDRGEWRGLPYVVTERVEGVSLAAWLQGHRAEGALPELRVVRALFDQVCRGVGAGHRARVGGPLVQRELSPAVVSVCEGPEHGGFAKTLEFGATQLVLPESAAVAPSRPSVYAAPEQALWEGVEATRESEVFALAVMLVEMLTLAAPAPGDRPFWEVSLRRDEAATVRSVLRALRPSVPSAVVAALATALSVRRDARPADAEVLRLALEAAWDAPVTRVVSAAPASVAPSSAGRGARVAGLGAMGGVALALLGAGSVAGVLSKTRTAPAQAAGYAAALSEDAAPRDQLDAERIPVGASPVDGSNRALVTVVEFGDARAAACRRAEPTLQALRARYGDDVRRVWKHNPVTGLDARLAAEAAQAAGAQGRFWEMNARLLAHAGALTRDDVARYADDLGLDTGALLAALDAHTYGPAVDADVALAQALGARGAPIFFVNGTPVTGALPLERLAAVVDRVLAAARDVTPAHAAYARMVAQPLAEHDPPRRVPPVVTAEGPRYALRANPAAPTRGATDAPVVLEVFSDFECPYCARVNPTLARIADAYGDLVRFTWRAYPLPRHHAAMPAAEAALEVYAQQGAEGFWRYHDALLAHQDALGRRDLERYARAQDVDIARLRTALDTRAHLPEIRADMGALAAVGIRVGTPAMFINGRYLEGAQPFEVFQRAIDAALAAWPGEPPPDDAP